MLKPVRAALAFLTAERLVMNTAFRFVYPFLPAIARGLGVPLEAAGYLVSARWAAGLATPVIQRAAGRGESRRSLIVTGCLLFIAGCAVTAITGVYAGALIGFVLIGLAKPAFDIASQAYVADRVPYARRARYLSVFELTWALALLVGAPVTGWMISRRAWYTPFWAFAALTVVAVLLVPRFIDADGPSRAEARERARFGSSGIVFLVVASLFTLAAELMFVVFAAWLEDSFALTLAALGGAAVLIGLAELAGEGATLAFTDRIGKRRAVVIGLAVSATSFALLAFGEGSLSIGLGLLAVALFGFEFTIVSAIPLATELQPERRAQFLAWMVVAMSAGRGLGAAIGPLLFGASGMAGPALAAVAADVVAGVLLVSFVNERAATGSVVNEERVQR
jgi:MFS transporter, DHA1 family, inner membrane transport protein